MAELHRRLVVLLVMLPKETSLPAEVLLLDGTRRASVHLLVEMLLTVMLLASVTVSADLQKVLMLGSVGMMSGSTTLPPEVPPASMPATAGMLLPLMIELAEMLLP